MAGSPESCEYLESAKSKFQLSDGQTTSLMPPLSDLFQALENSPFAVSLTEHIRFKQRFYFPEQGDADEVWAQWVEPFTSLMEHQRDFSHWGIAFHALEGSRFSAEEQMLGILADAIHDLGEAQVDGQPFVGDISIVYKTKEDEAKEAVVAHAAINAIPLNGANNEDLRGLLHVAYDEVVAGGNEKLHHAHKAREKWDYVRTAIHLFELTESDEESFRQFPIYSLDWFIARILAADLPKITTQLADYYSSSIGYQLKINSGLLERAFLRAQCFLDRMMTGEIESVIEDDYRALQQRLDNSYLLFRQWLANNQEMS